MMLIKQIINAGILPTEPIHLIRKSEHSRVISLGYLLGDNIHSLLLEYPRTLRVNQLTALSTFGFDDFNNKYTKEMKLKINTK